jgi:hypothetical protein
MIEKDRVPNPDQSPTKEKGPAELPGAEPKGDKAILGEQPETGGSGRLPGQTTQPPGSNEPAEER